MLTLAYNDVSNKVTADWQRNGRMMAVRWEYTANTLTINAYKPLVYYSQQHSYQHNGILAIHWQRGPIALKICIYSCRLFFPMSLASLWDSTDNSLVIQ